MNVTPTRCNTSTCVQYSQSESVEHIFEQSCASEVFENLASEHRIRGPETKLRGWDTGSGLRYLASGLPCMKSIEISDKARKQGRNGRMLSCTSQLHWVGSVPFLKEPWRWRDCLTLSLENLSYTTPTAVSLSLPPPQTLFYSRLKRSFLSLSHPKALRLCLALKTVCFYLQIFCTGLQHKTCLTPVSN